MNHNTYFSIETFSYIVVAGRKIVSVTPARKLIAPPNDSLILFASYLLVFKFCRQEADGLRLLCEACWHDEEEVDRRVQFGECGLYSLWVDVKVVEEVRLRVSRWKSLYVRT